MLTFLLFMLKFVTMLFIMGCYVLLLGLALFVIYLWWDTIRDASRY